MYKPFESDRLSWFRTKHRFLHYIEVASHEDYLEALVNRQEGSPICMLGNGSNCVFANKVVKACVVKNKLPKETRWIDDGTLWASSSVPLMSVLKQCMKASRNSFFYLSSVPATVGGAIAMNAGRGRNHNKTIFDFVHEVEFWTPEGTQKLLKDEIDIDYRHTVFLDHPEWFITGAKFKFTEAEFDQSENPIAQRVAFSQEVQDHSGPNCGSVFKLFHGGTMSRLMGMRLFKAKFSSKTQNWIVNRSASSRGILWLIRIAQLVHRLRRKKCHLEIRVIK